MNLRPTALFATLGCLLLASCYPYNENTNNRPRKGQTTQSSQQMLTAEEQMKLQEERDLLKEKEALKKKELARKQQAADPLPTNPTEPSLNDNTTPTTPTAPAKRPEYPTAMKAPGKDGFVLSPYNNKLVDVRDIPPGQLVQDPTYTGAGKGYFRVP